MPRFSTPLALAALACVSLPHQAQAQAASGWTGTWKGARGGTLMTLSDSGGILDAWGRDEASIYRLTCVVDSGDASTAQCVGEGVNHPRGTRFTYRSKLLLSGGGVSEQWEAQETAGRAEGRETFTRVPLRK